MHRYANPTRFLKIARVATPIVALLGMALTAAGLWIGLFASPPDYQQGESVRIMYVHVPAAWLASFVYVIMAAASIVSLVWRHALADVAAKAAAPLGAIFTAGALVTGSLWGQPTWGTWWVWDARLTSVLVLFFIYLGYMALWAAMEDEQKAARAAAILCLVGAVNIPIINRSVEWWNTLHQPASILRGDGPAMPPEYFIPLFVMAFAFSFAFAALHLAAMRVEILKRRAAALEARLS